MTGFLAMTANDAGKVAVLMGGDSAEREISLLSGKAVLQALCNEGVNAISVDLRKDLIEQLRHQNIDRVFIILHGRKGEDGKVQAVLELSGIPYTGSGVLACALAMDKVLCKKIWIADALPTPDFVELDEDTDWDEVIKALGVVFVKPVREGSSIGISCAENSDELKNAWLLAKKYDSAVIAEKFVNGKEFSVSILGDVVLPAVQLQTSNGFYDFNAKYESNETRYLCPPEISAEQIKVLNTLALKAYRSVGCHGWGRVDVMQDEEGNFWLLEVNTVPGMTDHSLVPIAAQNAGLSFGQLVLGILQSSSIDRNKE